MKGEEKRETYVEFVAIFGNRSKLIERIISVLGGELHSVGKLEWGVFWNRDRL